MMQGTWRLATYAGSPLRLPEDRLSALAPGTELTFGIRPENVALAPQAGSHVAELAGEVVQLEALGAETMVTATLGNAGPTLIARVAGDAGLRVGERCRFHLDLKAAHVFAADGAAIVPPSTLGQN